MIVDRSGTIRATSGAQGDPALENESSLRALIQRLLQEKRSAPASEGMGASGNADRERAPDFVLKDVRGTLVRLADYHGQVVLLEFWATWCEPCKAEIPWFHELQERYRDRGFAVLGVSMDETGANAVRRYAARQRVAYRVLLGNEPTARLYGGIRALPETVLIDREGRIVAKRVGMTSKSEEEREIDRSLTVAAR